MNRIIEELKLPGYQTKLIPVIRKNKRKKFNDGIQIKFDLFGDLSKE